jgi:hypothetical protein
MGDLVTKGSPTNGRTAPLAPEGSLLLDPGRGGLTGPPKRQS